MNSHDLASNVSEFGFKVTFVGPVRETVPASHWRDFPASLGGPFPPQNDLTEVSIMAGKKDTLIYAIGRARLTGPSSGVHRKKRCAELFVQELRALGCGVQKWTNLSNKHVAQVVARWQEKGLMPGTIKNYLTAVRDLCKAYGNDRIHPGNDAFGVARRVLVTNADKAVPQEVYARVVRKLSASPDPVRQNIALTLEYQRVLGMRLEEATKFNPLRDDLGDQAHIHRGAKGGRPRWLTLWNENQRVLLDQAKASGFYASPKETLIPRGMTESQWRDKVYAVISSLGLSRAACGASTHGLRHAYAQERYRLLTGFDAPAACTGREEFLEQAITLGGENWREKDELARCTIREEMGHSADRDIDKQYLGYY